MVGEPVYNVSVPPDFLMGVTTELVFHNAVFDLIMLEKAGIKIPDVPIYCTYNMSHIINEDYKYEGGHELSAVGKRYVGRESVKEKALQKLILKYSWEKTPASVMAVYAEQDAILPYDIYEAIKPMFEQWEDYWKREWRYSTILKGMIQKGIPFDYENCVLEFEKATKRREELLQEIGFNPNKGEALVRLFELPPAGFGIPVTHRTPGKKPQLNAKSIAEMQHPIKPLLQEYRKINTQITLFYNAYLRQVRPDYQRLHPGFKQNGTVTGRPTCSDPNMFQIPRESPIKKLFLAEEGYELWEFDYRNMEWYMGALYSKDENLLTMFREGMDMHLYTASQLNIGRQEAKIGGFTWLFMGGAEGISEQLGVPIKVAKQFVAGMKKAYPKVEATKQAAMRQAEQTGSIKIWTGRRRHFNNPRGCYTAFNFLTQGGSFEVLKESMLKLDEAGYDIRNCVYDSVWLMLPKATAEQDIPKVESLMSDWTEEAFGIRFPVEAKRLN